MIQVNCPTCGQRMQGQSVAEWPDFPFCSRRCKLVDLGRWFNEAYGLPKEESEEEPGRAPPDSEAP